MIALVIILWLIASMICCGVYMHQEQDYDDPWISMLASIIAWPLVAMFGFCYLILKQLAKIPMAIAGFLDAVRKDGT